MTTSDLSFPDSTWYMDTGASSHLGILHSIFNNCSNFLKHVIVGNGSQVPVTAQGHAYLPNSSLFLYNTLIAPSFIKNLVSVRQFTKDNSCSIEFDPLGFSVKDLRT